MAIHFTRELELTADARALVDFDMQSIRQMIAAARDSDPGIWIIEPGGYQADGHSLRDSGAIRLVAYVPESGTVYATDGCNSCRHRPAVRIEESSPAELESLSTHTQLPTRMMALLARLAAPDPERRPNSRTRRLVDLPGIE